MRKLDYLFRRLHKTGLTLFLAVLLVLVTLPALLFPRLYYRPPYVLQPAREGAVQFEFQTDQPLWEIAVKYRLSEYTADLNSYLSYLRQEKSALSPQDTDPRRRAYYNFLTDQEVLHLYYLREAIGWTGQDNYYFGRYAPAWVADMWEAIPRPRPLEEWNDPARWDLVITAGLGAKDPGTAAHARNLRDRLPLVQTGSTASGKVFEMTRQLRFLLLLIPLTVFLVLFQEKDRNLRRDSFPVLLYRHLAVFFYSGAGLLLWRAAAFFLLQLRYGDDEGAMHIVVPWAGEDAGSSGIMMLRRYIALLTLTDLAFVFFLLALVFFLERLTRHPLISAVLTAGLLCLPWPGRMIYRLADPLAYLRWQIVPQGFAGHVPTDSKSIVWQALSPLFSAAPKDVVLPLVLSGLCLSGLAFAAHRLRQNLHQELLDQTEVPFIK